MKTEVFRMERVTYKEQEIVQLDDFNLHIFEGEILGVIPLNLHGLSSLLKLLKTNVSLYDGYIYYNEIMINSWKSSNQGNNRITIIQNATSLVEGLTVVDNIFVLRNGYRGEYIKPAILEKQLSPFLEEIHMEMKADTYVEKLSVFERIVVELLKGIIAKHKLIVLNEIETLITGQELEKLHSIIRYYAKKGFTFIYICLHAEDIVQVCHRAVLLRNGRIEKTLHNQELTVDKLMSITKDYDRLIRGYLDDKKASSIKETKEYALYYQFKNYDAILNMKFKRAECTAIHCKDTEMYYDLKMAILNDDLGDGNFIHLDRKVFHVHPSRQVGIIQEVPTKTMIFPELSYIDNLCFNLDERMNSVWIKRSVRRSVKMEYSKVVGKEVFDLPIESLTEKEKYFLVYTRILLQKPKVVFCIQPFQGADLEHRMHIWTLLESLMKKGISVIILAVNISDSLSIAERLIQIDEKGSIKEYTSREFGDIPSLAPWKYLY